MMMGGMYGIIQVVILAVYVALIGLSIYGLILLIKALRRGIIALDYYNAEKKAMQSMESAATSLEENEYESTEDVETNDETTENTEQEDSEK